MHFEKIKIKNGFGLRPPLSNELERDAAGCCLDNAQVVHCVSAFGLISAANMGEKYKMLYMSSDSATDSAVKHSFTQF